MNQVGIQFTGDPKDLFSVADQVRARVKTVAQEIQNLGKNVHFSTTHATAPAKRVASEVDAINKQTAANAKQAQKVIEHATKQRVDAQIREEKRLEREAKKSATAFANSLNQKSAGSSISNALGSTNQLLAGLGLGVSVAGFISISNTAIDKAVEQSRANRLLAASAIEAGMAFEKAADKNKKFADQIGLSATAAAPTTGRILQLAARSGQPQNADRLLTGFADLGAAYGIDPASLRDLIGTILSGQDEGLNRLGIADPGQLQAAYAKQLGTTADKLTQMQKTQAAVNAVMEKSAMFTGTAEARMNSLEGSVAKTSARWDELTTGLSTMAANSPIATELIKTLSDTFGGLAFNIDKVNKALAEGKTPQEIAKELKPSPGLTEYLQSGATLAGGLLTGVAGLPALLASSTFRNAVNPFSVYDRNQSNLTDQIAGQARLNEKNDQAARTAEQSAAEKATKEKEAAEALEKQIALMDQFKTTISDTKTSFAELYELRRRADKEITDTKKAKEFIKQIDEAIKKSQEAARERVKELTESFKGISSSLFVGTYSDNPYVKLFIEGEDAVKKLREQTRGLSDDLRSQFEQMMRQQQGLAVFKQQIDSSFAAFDLRTAARGLRDFTQPETPEQFRKRIDDTFRQATSAGNFFGFNAVDTSQFSDTDRADIAGRWAASMIDRSIVGNRSGVAIETFRRFQSQGEDARQSAQDRLDAQLKLANSFSPQNEQQRAAIDAKIVSLAQGLDPASLRADQRNQLAASMERQAERAETRQQESIAVQREHLKVSQSIDANQKRLLAIAEQQGKSGIDIIVKDETRDGISANQKPKAPGLGDVARTYELGMAGGTNL